MGSLRIDGTTIEETSTDLSIDMGRIINESSDDVVHSDDTGKAFKEQLDSDDSDEVEILPEEPIVPVIKTEAPKKIKGSDGRKTSSQQMLRDKNVSKHKTPVKTHVQKDEQVEIEKRKDQEL